MPACTRCLYKMSACTHVTSFEVSGTISILLLLQEQRSKNFREDLCCTPLLKNEQTTLAITLEKPQFIVDRVISSGCFKDRLLDTFGPVVYELEHCGIYFSVFLFVELFNDRVIMIVRHMEIDKLTACTLEFGDILFRTSYKFFFRTSVIGV